MKFRIYSRIAIANMAFVSCFLGSVPSVAQNAYITNSDANNVSVINTAKNRVTGTIPVGIGPICVAISPDASKL